jgi:hypothetical protein
MGNPISVYRDRAPWMPVQRRCAGGQVEQRQLFRQPVEGYSMTDLDRVLAHIDAERDNSLDRLFNFLSIKSISTDPAYADECNVAAVSLAADLSSLDIPAEVHPTDGHSIVLAKSPPSGSGRKRVVFYGH